jgi:hemolysin type calcium-binding protein
VVHAQVLSARPPDRLRTEGETHTFGVFVRHSGLLSIVLAAALMCVSQGRSAADVEVVLSNENFQTLAVDPSGTAFGISRDTADPTYKFRLYTSPDEGATWSPVHDFPKYARITSAFSVLSDGTLLAGVTTGTFDLFRSADHGVTWTKVFTFPDGYQILTPHSITDDGTHAFMGSYNLLDPGNHLNWVWRSDDMGSTWRTVRETSTHRHVHFAQIDPYTGDLYVGYGDTNAGQAEIERSRDAGETWESVCTGTRCLSVDIAFDPDGFAIFGQDHVWEPGWIVRLDLESGETTKIAPLPGPSYSAMRLNDAYWLVGEAHEAHGTIFDPADHDLHVFASDDGGASFADAIQRPYLDAGSTTKAMMQYRYPNGDFPIIFWGYGTLVARFVNPSPDTAQLDRTEGEFEGESFELGIEGSGFVPDTSAVLWNGSPRPTTYVDVNHLHATISAEDLTVVGQAEVTVANGTPGGGVSSPLIFVVGKAPNALAAPLLAGTPRKYETLSCVNGTWVGDDLSFATTWLRDGVELDGATGADHVVGYGDVGHSLSCKVTAENALGSESSESSPVVPLPLEPILGTSGPDELVGTYHEDTIRGYGADDVLRGLEGPDQLYGGGGPDVLNGGPGKDLLVGAFGNDRISVRDGSIDTISCGQGHDVVVADRIDHVTVDCERVRYAVAGA